MFVLMRVYFEKPRTTIGWKGLINDPTWTTRSRSRRASGRRANCCCSWPTSACRRDEALDPIMPQYLSELVTWTAIGARTTESQTHREMASGLSTPVGFKNGHRWFAVGRDQRAAVRAPSASLLGITQQGQSAVFRTRGNRYGHMVLRGGGGRPNYDSVSIALCERELEKAGLPVSIVVDCSHGNSNKDPGLQTLVAENVGNQILEGNRSIVG